MEMTTCDDRPDMKANGDDNDSCANCGHRRVLHRPDCHFNRAHAQGDDKVCHSGPGNVPCAGFLEPASGRSG